MDKSLVVALFVSALCFSSALARNSPLYKFAVKGKIYCDPCHFKSESRLSYPLAGVRVSVQCMTDYNTYFKEGKTDANGMYNVLIDGDHEGWSCDVEAYSPVEGECKEAMPYSYNGFVLNQDMSVSSTKRFVNPLGFMTKTIDAQCNSVAKELGLDQPRD